MYTGVATMENYGGSAKSKNRTTIWSNNFTPEHVSEENKITNSKRYMHPVFTAALFIIAKTWKQTECPSADWWENICEICM